MRVRRGFMAGALLCSWPWLPAVAHAAGPSCAVVGDPANDPSLRTEGETQLGPVAHKTIDLTSAEVSVEDGVLYATIRVVSLTDADLNESVPPDLTDLLDRQGKTSYRLELTAGDRTYFVQTWALRAAHDGRKDLSGQATGGRVGGRAYHVRLDVDTGWGELRFAADLDAFGDPALRTRDVRTLTATAAREYSDNGQLAPGRPSRVWFGDDAAGPAKLRPGKRASCLHREW